MTELLKQADELDEHFPGSKINWWNFMPITTDRDANDWMKKAALTLDKKKKLILALSTKVREQEERIEELRKELKHQKTWHEHRNYPSIIMINSINEVINPPKKEQPND